VVAGAAARALINPLAQSMLTIEAAAGAARHVHRAIRGYAPTPLVELPGLAAALGVGRLLVKDESQRFGLKAFKALGASYAIARWAAERWRERGGEKRAPESLADGPLPERIGPVTFATATDGNHGRSVAWTARRLGQRAAIFMPALSAPARVEAIRGEGAKVMLVDGDYDAAVRRCADEAARHGWQVVSDTSWPGYVEIPRWVSDGYLTLFEEVDEQLAARGLPPPDVVLVQVGVGALPAAAVSHYRAVGRAHRPRLVCVEPRAAACLLDSIAVGDGEPHVASGDLQTIMAGLACATPSLIAWPLVRDGFELFVAIDDEHARQAMRRLYHPIGSDPRVISGESGAAGLGALLALAGEAALAGARAGLGPDGDTTVLLLNTEGDTDPGHFAQVVGTPP
jgi:diaminopropionate ammonia-lyase